MALGRPDDYEDVSPAELAREAINSTWPAWRLIEAEESIVMKPPIKNADIQRIRSQIVREQPSALSWWIRYGAGLSASCLGISLWAAILPASLVFNSLLFIAVTHWWARKRFGYGDALSSLDAFDLTPSPEIRRIESDPECKAFGINVKRDDWPAIFKTGMRVEAVMALETFDSKALSLVGYGCVLLALLAR